MEQKYVKPVELITGFRPCQWLVGYEWSSNPANDALWLTASICYDATDLKLASDLRDRSDVFAIPALNLDVGTFDQMAQALHYHMRSEEHTYELQSLMRISYAVFCLKKTHQH